MYFTVNPFDKKWKGFFVQSENRRILKKNIDLGIKWVARILMLGILGFKKE